jgi:dihydrofolate reductase
MMNNQIKKAPISIIAVLSEKDRAIGENDKLLWSIPEDLKRFKLLTSGNPVIMGRKTFESIIRYLKKPLPDRINIIVTRNLHFNYDHDDVIIANSLEQALERARALSPKEIFIIGGGEIYKQAISFTDQLYLTLVDEQ